MGNEIVLSIILTTLLIFILIIGVIISFFMVGQQRSKQEIILTQANLNYEQELRKVESELSEGVKRHIAQELHDNVGHLLTCMRLEIENKKLDHPELIGHITSIDQYLQETSDQLRLLSRTLNSDFLEKLDFYAAMDLEVERLKRLRKLEIQWVRQQDRLLVDTNNELILFRISQEIISNALRHSNASKLKISCSAEPNFQLVFEDDGKGFETTKILNSAQASGLQNILKRTELIGMKCEITSILGDGSSITITKKTNESNN